MTFLFNNNQQLDGSELVDSLAKKLPRIHKEIIISQGFNPDTGDLETFAEHCERADTTDKIFRDKCSASDEDSDITKNKKFSKKNKASEDSGKKRRKNSSLYCSPHGENNSHT